MYVKGNYNQKTVLPFRPLHKYHVVSYQGQHLHNWTYCAPFLLLHLRLTLCNFFVLLFAWQKVFQRLFLFYLFIFYIIELLSNMTLRLFQITSFLVNKYIMSALIYFIFAGYILPFSSTFFCWFCHQMEIITRYFIPTLNSSRYFTLLKPISEEL